MFKDIYVEAKNIVLKPYCMDDIDDLYALYSDEIVMKYPIAVSVGYEGHEGYEIPKYRT